MFWLTNHIWVISSNYVIKSLFVHEHVTWTRPLFLQLWNKTLIRLQYKAVWWEVRGLGWKVSMKKWTLPKAGTGGKKNEHNCCLFFLTKSVRI